MREYVSVCTSALFCCMSVGLGKLLVQFGLEYIEQPIGSESLTDGCRLFSLRALVNSNKEKKYRKNREKGGEISFRNEISPKEMRLGKN